MEIQTNRNSNEIRMKIQANGFRQRSASSDKAQKFVQQVIQKLSRVANRFDASGLQSLKFKLVNRILLLGGCASVYSSSSVFSFCLAVQFFVVVDALLFI